MDQVMERIVSLEHYRFWPKASWDVKHWMLKNQYVIVASHVVMLIAMHACMHASTHPFNVHLEYASTVHFKSHAWLRKQYLVSNSTKGIYDNLSCEFTCIFAHIQHICHVGLVNHYMNSFSKSTFMFLFLTVTLK